jgi:hypothetical protein
MKTKRNEDLKKHLKKMIALENETRVTEEMSALLRLLPHSCSQWQRPVLVSFSSLEFGILVLNMSLVVKHKGLKQRFGLEYDDLLEKLTCYESSMLIEDLTVIPENTEQRQYMQGNKHGVQLSTEQKKVATDTNNVLLVGDEGYECTFMLGEIFSMAFLILLAIENIAKVMSPATEYILSQNYQQLKQLLTSKK